MLISELRRELEINFCYKYDIFYNWGLGFQICYSIILKRLHSFHYSILVVRKFFSNRLVEMPANRLRMLVTVRTLAKWWRNLRSVKSSNRNEQKSPKRRCPTGRLTKHKRPRIGNYTIFSNGATQKKHTTDFVFNFSVRIPNGCFRWRSAFLPPSSIGSTWSSSIASLRTFLPISETHTNLQHLSIVF